MYLPLSLYSDILPKNTRLFIFSTYFFLFLAYHLQGILSNHHKKKNEDKLRSFVLVKQVHLLLTPILFF